MVVKQQPSAINQSKSLQSVCPPSHHRTVNSLRVKVGGVGGKGSRQFFVTWRQFLCGECGFWSSVCPRAGCRRDGPAAGPGVLRTCLWDPLPPHWLCSRAVAPRTPFTPLQRNHLLPIRRHQAQISDFYPRYKHTHMYVYFCVYSDGMMVGWLVCLKIAAYMLHGR